jgi:Fic family protein
MAIRCELRPFHSDSPAISISCKLITTAFLFHYFRSVHLQLILDNLFPDFLLQTGNLLTHFEALEEAELSTEHFSFYSSVASVFSSKIEGEDIDLDSYVKHKRWGADFRPDYTRKTDDLYSAYEYARIHSLSPESIAHAHSLLARNFVDEKHLGRLRTGNMYVTTPDGKIEYVAPAPHELPCEMEKFYADLSLILQQKLSIEEAFYFASYVHLVFVKIHPWTDGNGRTARLLEKWLLAHHLGPKAWLMQSERYYYENHTRYYQNLRALGLEYESLDYGQALPFLGMLAGSVASAKSQ